MTLKVQTVRQRARCRLQKFRLERNSNTKDIKYISLKFFLLLPYITQHYFLKRMANLKRHEFLLPYHLMSHILQKQQLSLSNMKLQDRQKKLVVICQDKTTLNANGNQLSVWADHITVRKFVHKRKGSEGMVSDFIDENGGFLALSNEEHNLVVAVGRNMLQHAMQGT